MISLWLFIILLCGWTTTYCHCSHPKFHHQQRYESCLKNHSSPPLTDNQRCITLNHPYCLGIKLPYNSITLPDQSTDLNLTSVEDVQTFLASWQTVQNIDPECWTYLRIALCSLTMPQCEEDPMTFRRTKISKSSLDICNDLITKNNCKFIQRHYKTWPSIFNCSDNNLYKTCTNELREFRNLKTNSPSCQYPLVASSENVTWFKDIRGCTLTCKWPIIDEDDQNNINYMIYSLSSIAIILSILGIILFDMNRKICKTSRMAKVIQWCTIIGISKYLGWLLQFITRTNIACSSTGGPLIGIPFVANWCILSHILIYAPNLATYFLVSYLAKLSHDKILGKHKDRSGLGYRFYFMIFIIPAFLFLIIQMFGQKMGHGLYGICTVGMDPIGTRLLSVEIPQTLSSLFSLYYYSITIHYLARRDSMKPEIKRTLWRMALLIVLIIVDLVFTWVILVYEQTFKNDWVEEVDKYLACNMNLASTGLYPTNTTHLSSNFFENRSNCSINRKPIALLYYLELLPKFSIGIVISSWLWCSPNNIRGLLNRLLEIFYEEKDKNVIKNDNLLDRDDDSDITDRKKRNYRDIYLNRKHDIIDMTSMKKPEEPEIDDLVVVPNLRRSDSLASASLSLDQSIDSNFHSIRPSRNRNSQRYKVAQMQKPPESIEDPNIITSRWMYESILTINRYMAFLRSRPNIRERGNKSQSIPNEDPPFIFGMYDDS